PFDDEDADIVVRSADEVDFRLYRVVLCKGSHAFRDMFAAGSAPMTPDEMDEGGRPIIRLPEPARTLRLLFRLMYPVANGDLSDPNDIRALLTALDKYCVEGSSSMAEEILLAQAERSPEFVYALAVRFRLPTVGKRAAQLTLRKPSGLVALSEEDASFIPGLLYHRLVTYQNHAISVAANTVKTFTWPSVDRPAPPPALPSDLCGCRRLGFVGGAGKVESTMPFWLMDYRTKCIAALQKAPVGSVVLEPELLFQTLGMYAQPSVCSECARRISGPLHTFCRTLAAEIDRRVGEV
ncbi:hypothetical protein PENSPDRAFT_548901, partial [Peniophora sp. CONT]